MVYIGVMRNIFENGRWLQDIIVISRILGYYSLMSGGVKEEDTDTEEDSWP